MTKQKVPPMSEQRKALFAEYPWCDEEQAWNLHMQLSTALPKLKTVYELAYTGDDEQDGNLILRSFLDDNCPEKVRERELRMAERHRFMCQHRRLFQNTFGQPLSWYWDNVTGFDVIKFDTDLVQSPDGKSTRDCVRERWGDKALELIETLMK